MEKHNGADVVKEVHRVAASILAAPTILEIGEEIASK
jgi:hypothetical protein